MERVARRLYVISDLHLGGEPADGERNERGFRICTHSDDLARFVEALAGKASKGDERIELILNGDTVDFLAETDPVASSWSPFTADPVRAVEKFNAIVSREESVFGALHRLLDAGGRLVVLLGNHDIELSLPPVRAAFRGALALEPCHDFEFIYDGEAYVVGDALIEHGNRYDRFNRVDHDALRRFRSLLSRRQDVPADYGFVPPAGSRLVTSVMNPIKRSYPFVDLLKPEQEAVIPLLLALEPGYRRSIGKLAELAWSTVPHGSAAPALPAWGGDIQSDRDRLVNDFGGNMVATNRQAPPRDEPALDAILRHVLGAGSAQFQRAISVGCDRPDADETFGADVSARETLTEVGGLFRLLMSRKSAAVTQRLPSLLQALRGLQRDDSFNTAVESTAEYLDAARELAKNGIRYVVFGHTHKAKHVALAGASAYLNSGTWADLLKFPVEMLSLPDAQALRELESFVDCMRTGDFSRWIEFQPTYVLLDFSAAGTVMAAHLCRFAGAASGT